MLCVSCDSLQQTGSQHYDLHNGNTLYLVWQKQYYVP
jgi:hypothetical protein